MGVSEQQQLFELVERALDQAQEQRGKWLKTQCPEHLYPEALALLRSSEMANTDSIDFRLSVPSDIGRHEDYLGTRLGAYELTHLIGEGGMGYVFAAHRADGAFEQKVAVKLIRASRLTGSMLIKKFERERQILSDLNHPNIAALYDGGTTDDGIPYLVMEYVEGVSIDEHVKATKPSLEQLLDVFVKVCSAVRAAHRSLIIHRDIKPANILVDKDGQPKLLDFGIARSIDPVHRGGEKTMLVQLTPTYASPEQIRNEELGTATDVYSLGVVLYEALTGTLPYEVTGLSAFKAEQLITQAAQPTPSRKTHDFFALENNMRANELDAIVLKALAVDIERRYESAGALMDDLKRFLRSQPVEAQLDTPAYRLRKLIARNKGVAFATLFAVVALAVGLTVSLVQTHKARQELARAEAVGGYLRSILLSPEPGANSQMQLGPDATVKDLLLAAERTLETDLADQPSVKIELYNTLSTAQMWMNDMDAALRMTRKAVALAASNSKASDYELMEAIHVLGTVLEDDHKADSAIVAYEEALEMAQRLGPEASYMRLIIRNDLAVTYANINRWPEALSLQQRTVEIQETETDPDIAVRSALLGNLGHFQFESGLAEQAERSLVEAIEMAADLEEASYYRLRSKQRLARLLDFTGRHDQAMAAYRENIDQANLKHIETEDEIVTAQLRMAIIDINQGNVSRARETIEAARIEFVDYLNDEESWIFHAADAVLQNHDRNFTHALAAADKAKRFSLIDRRPDSERIRIDTVSVKALAGLGRLSEAEVLLEDVQRRAVEWLGEKSYIASTLAGLSASLIPRDSKQQKPIVEHQ